MRPGKFASILLAISLAAFVQPEKTPLKNPELISVLKTAFLFIRTNIVKNKICMAIL